LFDAIFNADSEYDSSITRKVCFDDKNLVKVIFLNKEKERKTSDAFVCNGWYGKLNEKEYFTSSPSM
jgi:hypothetical protein